MPGLTDLTQCDKMGIEVSLYYDTADDPATAGGSTCSTPTWVFHKGITGDISINETEDEEELTSRDPALRYKQYTESKGDLEVSGEQALDMLYEGFIYLNSMRGGSYARNMLVLTGYLTELNNIGFKGKWRNFDRSITGPETGPSKQQFKLKPAACVRPGCYITPVKTAAAGTTTNYVPENFAVYSTTDLAQEIMNHDIYRGIKNTTAEEIFTNVTPVIGWLGVEETDKLLVSLIESQPVINELNPRSARRFNQKATGMGCFNRAALLAALDEIVKNVLGN